MSLAKNAFCANLHTSVHFRNGSYSLVAHICHLLANVGMFGSVFQLFAGCPRFRAAMFGANVG